MTRSTSKRRRVALFALICCGLLASMILLALSLALTSTNTVPATRADSQSFVQGINDVKPIECTMTIDNRTSSNALVISTGNTFDLILGGPVGQTITSGGRDDCVFGGGGNDSISGGAQNDTLFGGNGNDTLNGGAGTDICYGGPGTDIFISCETQIQ